MNAQDARNQLAEINLFITTAEGLSGHIKLTEVPAVSAVKTLRELSQAAASAGMAAQAPRQTSNDEGTAPTCPNHPGKTKPSQHQTGGFYCTAKVVDGYCKWSWKPS